MPATLPVAIIGAGPMGLAAAAELRVRGLVPLVLEAGPRIAHAVRHWGHVRMFSPWASSVSAAARALLEPRGWAAPDPAACPTGNELADRYLDPLAAALAPHLRLGARVVGVARQDRGRGAMLRIDGAPAARNGRARRASIVGSMPRRGSRLRRVPRRRDRA